ncbi:MAG: homoserine O-acetyltransferase [Cyclobacteriaceae bacterium]|nr:homoserine O-acetyltransferase [Cyclobacteriaceae bacterium]MCX7637510.1 homoserine O-acetyltransferase [Cyclobacteriaceae bacterium]MDW8332021.1 homoserine O-acetyltransferase [Cyclobacteriaceae bacterium]
MIATHHDFEYPKQFELESGKVLPGFRLRYTTLGRLNADRTNTVWVCHALTGSSDVTQWWAPLFSEEGIFAPEKYFIICVNTLGGCYGSTGPLSVNPETKKPYYHDFPQLTTRDVARAFDLLRKHLGLEKIHTLIGGSLGGQQVLQWAILQPHVFGHIVPIACNAFHSPWGIAFNEAQRMAIEADSTWKENRDDAGCEGLKAARAIAMLSYRNYTCYGQTQQGIWHDSNQFKAVTYQRYHGEKLAKRFNAFTYYVLSRMMDSHQVGTKSDSAEEALGRIQGKTLVIGIDSDILYPLQEQEYLASAIPGARLAVLSSLYGHDGFLAEFGQLKQALQHFYSHHTQTLFLYE